MYARLVLRSVIVAIVLAAGLLLIARILMPDRLVEHAPRLAPVRYQVDSLLAAFGEDREAGEIRAETLDRGRALARAHPLDPLPYTLVQLVESAEGNPETANRAALTALSFQPRSRAARMHVVNQLVAVGAFDEALDQITLLSRIDPGGQETYHTAILRLVQDRAAWPAIRRAVTTDPPWKEPVLIILARSTIDTGFLQSLFESWPERIDILLDRYIRDGDIDTAYLTFLSALPTDANIAVPYDAGFTGQPGHEPFNWRVNTRYAELAEEGGLDVSYFGRGRVALAEQVFPLSPGTYRLEAGFEGTFNPESAGFGFRIRCASGAEPGPLIAEWSLEPDAILEGRVQHDFTHTGAGCDYAHLEFRAVPGLLPATSRLQLTGLSLASLEPDDT